MADLLLDPGATGAPAPILPKKTTTTQTLTATDPGGTTAGGIYVPPPAPEPATAIAPTTAPTAPAPAPTQPSAPQPTGVNSKELERQVLGEGYDFGSGWLDEYQRWLDGPWYLGKNNEAAAVQERMKIAFENYQIQDAKRISEEQATTLVDTDGDGRPDSLVDGLGNVVRDYSDIISRIDQAAGTQVTDFSSWMAQQGNQFFDPNAVDAQGNFLSSDRQGIEDLINQFQTGPTAGDIAGAENFAASRMGLTTAEMDAIMNSGALANIDTVSGLAAGERAVRERLDRSNIRQAEDRATRMIQSIGANTGSATQAYMQADQALRQIRDMELQQELSLYDEDFRRKQANLNAQKQQWEFMVQSGSMSQAEYLDRLEQGKAQAFQGYALNMANSLAQNEQYFKAYQADFNAVQQQIANTYQAINMELGLDTQMLGFVNDFYDTNMKPVLDRLTLSQSQMDLYSPTFWDTFSTIVSTVADIGGIVANVAIPGVE